MDVDMIIGVLILICWITFFHVSITRLYIKLYKKLDNIDEMNLFQELLKRCLHNQIIGRYFCSSKKERLKITDNRQIDITDYLCYGMYYPNVR